MRDPLHPPGDEPDPWSEDEPALDEKPVASVTSWDMIRLAERARVAPPAPPSIPAVEPAQEDGPGRARLLDDLKLEEGLLVRKAREGDTEAFADLMRRRAPGVVAFLRRMLGDAEDARDVAQLTFLRVWENLHRYDASWAFSTWLFRIASNLAIDAIRARGTRQRTETENIRLSKLAPTSSTSGGPEGLARQEVRRVFEACASALSEKQRLVFVLRELEDRESSEIAGILGCRESTVRNHLFQARRLLREEMKRRFPEYVRGLSGGGSRA